MSFEYEAIIFLNNDGKHKHQIKFDIICRAFLFYSRTWETAKSLFEEKTSLA